LFLFKDDNIKSKEKAVSKSKPDSTVNAKPLAGRDLGLSKGKAAKTNQSKHRRAFENVNDYRMKQGDRAARKREMEHELAMEKARAKRLKYELKAKQADADREARLSEIREQREARESELKLQLELVRIQAAVDQRRTAFQAPGANFELGGSQFAYDGRSSSPFTQTLPPSDIDTHSSNY
jgi:hypothetical protein